MGLLAFALFLIPPGLPPMPDSPSRFVRVGESRVHYKSFGEGSDALVLVHGWACNMGFWSLQVEAFRDRIRVLVVDLPGHGGSDKPEGAYTAALYVSALKAALDDAGVSRATLVGHSMGVPVVREFYRRFPGQTLALVAVDGPLRNPVGDPRVYRRVADLYRGPSPGDVLAAAVESMTRVASASLRAAIKAEMQKTPAHVLASAVLGMADPALYGPDPIRVPLLVVNAPSAQWSGSYEAYVRSLAGDVEYRSLEGSDHFLMLDKPTEFNAILAGFLQARHLMPPSIPPRVGRESSRAE